MPADREMINVLIKCKFLYKLGKENEAVTAGPAGISTVGYMNPLYSHPSFEQRKKKKKEKCFMKADGFVGDIEELTDDNKSFRRVLYTGHNTQLVLMSLRPGEEIGSEVHEDIDQFFRVDAGIGVVVIDGKTHNIKDGAGIIVPAGAEHNVINTSKTDELKIYTLYSPPEHKDKIVRETKEDAETQKEHFDGNVTEEE